SQRAGAGWLAGAGAAAVAAACAASDNADPDMQPTILPPAMLAQQLAPLALLADPLPLLQGLWRGLLRVSRAAQTVMGLFEQRFYLAGVMLALISLLLLMAQG
ncbi:MAG: hypothetical protein HC876_17705, partial [Chloroflexaceae bacterium]|nr:hypothetical protein [Chloroflexaceae bacterium]